MKAQIVTVVLVMLSVACLGAEEEAPGIDDFAAVAKAVSDSVVIVEYELKFDKGEARGYGWQRNGGELILDERPLELEGFLLGPTTVITIDPMLPPRFVEGIQVRFNEQRLNAEPAAYVVDYGCMLLELDRPFDGAEPLTFNAEADPPYFDVDYNLEGEGWTVSVSAYSENLSITENGMRFIKRTNTGAVTDKNGAAIGLAMGERLPADGSWKGSPLKWAAVPAKEMAEHLNKLEEHAAAGLLRIKLNFRSPKAADPRLGYFRRPDDDDSATERNVIGVLVAPKTILVLAYLKPKVTARLEQITVYREEGEPVSAEFMHTLKDYGCFLAAVKEPLGDPIELREGKITDLYEKLLLSAEVKVQGDKRVVYFYHKNLTGFRLGRHRQAFPEFHGQVRDLFLFDLKGRLVALPLVHREKATVEERWSSSRETRLMPAAYVRKVINELPEQIDPGNVPLSEEEENRLAWMGVEMQALNKDLARANNVSDLTQGGETGALVSYVYPGSPAAEAGIEPGHILLRLHIQGQPKPMEVKLEEGLFARESFPWNRLDEVPEQFYDRIPKPWPPAENSFSRVLTDVGFGKKYTADFFHNGEVVSKEFVITQSPKHYDSAPRHKAEELGVTIRDLTYEVRRYFQKKPDDPGVIVSKLEPGSKASVAGIKPYEIITHINDKPVMNVKDFEKLAYGQKELRLSVKRMTRGRVVPIKISAPADKEKKEEVEKTE